MEKFKLKRRVSIFISTFFWPVHTRRQLQIGKEMDDRARNWGSAGEDIFIAVRLLFKLFRIAFASVAAMLLGDSRSKIT